MVFENQIIEPPIVCLANPNVDNWIKKHKIDNNKWKIADVDNYMSGNKFFKEVMDNSEFKQFVSKYKQRKDLIDDRVSKY